MMDGDWSARVAFSARGEHLDARVEACIVCVPSTTGNFIAHVLGSPEQIGEMAATVLLAAARATNGCALATTLEAIARSDEKTMYREDRQR